MSSFSEAFRKARAEGKLTFKWRGGTYTTQKSGEEYRPQKVYATLTVKDGESLYNFRGAEDVKLPFIEQLQYEQAKDPENKQRYVIGTSSRGGNRAIIMKNDNTLINAYTEALHLAKKSDSKEANDHLNRLTDMLGVTYGMPQVNVVANYRNAADKKGNAMPGWVPVKDGYVYDGKRLTFENHPLKGRMFENIETGEFGIISPDGREIIARSDDPTILTDPYNSKIYAGYYQRPDVLDNSTEIKKGDRQAEDFYQPFFLLLHKLRLNKVLNDIQNTRNAFGVAGTNFLAAPAKAAFGTLRAFFNMYNKSPEENRRQFIEDITPFPWYSLDRTYFGDIFKDHHPDMNEDVYRFLNAAGEVLGPQFIGSPGLASAESNSARTITGTAGRARTVELAPVNFRGVRLNKGFRGNPVKVNMTSEPHHIVLPEVKNQVIADITKELTGKSTKPAGKTYSGSSFRVGNVHNENGGTYTLSTGTTNPATGRPNFTLRTQPSYTLRPVTEGNFGPQNVTAGYKVPGLTITLWDPIKMELPNRYSYRYPLVTLPIKPSPEEVEPKPLEKDFQGTEVVYSRGDKKDEDGGGDSWGWRFVSGQRPETDYSVIPNESNTRGSTYVWKNSEGEPISKVTGYWASKETPTHGKPHE